MAAKTYIVYLRPYPSDEWQAEAYVYRFRQYLYDRGPAAEVYWMSDGL
jgi:hypothetical protein